MTTAAFPMHDPKESDERDPELILLFDGICNLCSWSVQFIIRRDPHARIRFASLQSAAAGELLRDHNLTREELDAAIFFEGRRVYVKSAAVLRVFRYLPGLWRLLTHLTHVPASVRDWCYDRIAENRYKLFGRKDRCLLPTEELSARFLESLPLSQSDRD